MDAKYLIFAALLFLPTIICKDTLLTYKGLNAQNAKKFCDENRQFMTCYMFKTILIVRIKSDTFLESSFVTKSVKKQGLL